VKPAPPATRPAYQALQGVAVGPHQLGVPGRHEADALTDCCPRTSCLTPVRPAAVLDEVHGTKTTGRYAAYRCPACDAAWLCWWAAP
jgi:hypothetical protein